MKQFVAVLILIMSGINSYLFWGTETNQSVSNESSAVTPTNQLLVSLPIQAPTTVEDNSPEEQDEVVDESTVLPLADEYDSTAFSENNNLDNRRHYVFDQAAWDTAKEGRLADVIDTLVPEEIAKHFKFKNKAHFVHGHYPTWCNTRKAFKRHYNCNEPMTIQTSDKEEVWVAVMEYNFRYLISKYESDDEIKLLDVSCKQLICELFISIGTGEVDEYDAQPINSIYNYLINSIELKLLRHDRAKHITGYGQYVYFVFAFYEDFSED